MVAVLLLAVGCAMPQPAHRIFLNGRIYTFGDPPFARAIAVDRNGRIVGIDDVRGLIGPKTDVVDLDGAVVIPGLADAHAHLESFGRTFFTADLVGCRSYEEMIERVVAWARAHPDREWIIGRGWNQELWPDEKMPVHDLLSRRIPDRPVWLRRIDGHAALANAEAMRRAGVTRETPAPPGGEILRGPAGEPTGVFVDAAMSLVEVHIPQPSRAEIAQHLLEAQRRCFEVGLTMVHDAGMDLQIWSVLRELRAQGRWKLRVYAMLTGPASFLMEELRGRAPELDPVLTLRAVKVYLDGALGSRGAWLLEPYSDRPDTSGLNLLPEEQFRAIVRAAAERGWQVAVHAIGDRANRLALDVFHGVSPEARMRVEHAQVVALEDLPRFAQQGVIASIQPTHATSDMNMAEERVGPRRIRGAYAWRSLLDSGAVMAAGSDFPVESHNPLWGVYAAVTRQDHEGNPPGGWYPEQRMTVEEAFRAFTIGAAYAAFREHDLGRLMPGYFADFTAYDVDVLRCEPREWLQVRPRMVAIGGELVYRR